MIAFIDDQRAAYGVEPICRVLLIAPSTYHAHVARRADPTQLPARAKRDAAVIPEVRRVFAENFGVYDVRKVWRQLGGEGHHVARCTVARLMRSLGLQGVIRGKPVRTTISDKAASCPLDRVNRQFQAARPNGCGSRLHLCGDLGGVPLRRLHHRCLRAADRRLARITNGACGLRAGRPETGSA
jgi:transposase InsO family protein